MPTTYAIQWKRLTAEGVAIVLSILAAFWIDAWWEYRSELADEIAILQNLENEFAINRERLLEDIEEVSDYIQAAQRLLAASAIDWTMQTSVASLGTDLWRTMSWRTTNLNTATLDSVISAGHLALIRNDVLRTALPGWPSRLDDMAEEELFEWREITERYRPFVGRVLPIPSLEGTEAAPPDPEMLRRLMESNEFHSLLSMRLDVSLVALDDKQETLAELNRIQDQLRNVA